MILETTILTVNYNTPELLQELLKSIDKFCPDINTCIVDGSDDKNSSINVRAKFINRL